MINFTNRGWSDYIYWKKNDKSISKKIDRLIKDTLRNPFSGIGKPEPLKENLSGFWSKRVTNEHRFIYRYENETLYIISCRFHY